MAKYGFLVHLAVYAAVMALLIVINMLTSPRVTWFIWPLIGWGLAVALHAMLVFALGGHNAAIDALTEWELQHSTEDESGSRS